MNFVYGIVKSVAGGTKEGTFIDSKGRFKALVVVEEDQSWKGKDGELHAWMANIPFSFWGKEAERLANDPDHYLGKRVKVDYQLGGYNPPDKPGVWYGNINGKFIHNAEMKEEVKKNETDIPF